MATGRTVSKWLRVFVGGYDLSGYTRTIGPLRETYAENAGAALSDEVVGILPGHATLGVGALNGWFAPGTAGLHALHAAGLGTPHVLSVCVGIRDVPAIGDPVYAAEFEQGAYLADPAPGMVAVNVPFALPSAAGATLLYSDPWGRLLNANTARTAANSATGAGVESPTAAATAFGGYLAYHVTAGNGTATISIDDSANDSSYSALSGATTGSIDCSTPRAGIVALGRTATVRRYLRWQIALGTATTVTFCLSFHRALF